VAATVDIQGDTGEVGGVFGREEGDGGGDLFGGSRSAYRHLCGDGGFLFAGAANADIGVDRSRGDGVDRDTCGA
jgi:hypothetical protein